MAIYRKPAGWIGLTLAVACVGYWCALRTTSAVSERRPVVPPVGEERALGPVVPLRQTPASDMTHLQPPPPTEFSPAAPPPEASVLPTLPGIPKTRFFPGIGSLPGGMPGIVPGAAPTAPAMPGMASGSVPSGMGLGLPPFDPLQAGGPMAPGGVIPNHFSPSGIPHTGPQHPGQSLPGILPPLVPPTLPQNPLSVPQP